MQVRPVADLDAAGVAGALAVVQRADRAVDPDIEPTTAEEFRRQVADDRSDGNRHLRTAVLDGDRVRAVAHLELDTDEENAHLATAEVFGAAADPDAGRVAVADLVERCEADGRTSLAGWGPRTEAEARFWTAFGATERYTERMSNLDLATVDPDLMADWIDRRRERAADVSLVRWTGACPDEHRAAYARSVSAMSDAPTDDLDVNPFTIDEDDVRELDDARLTLGWRPFTVFAVDPDGRPAGHTTVLVNPFRPDASWQWDTVVLASHRRRGIGRWIKAEMWRWLRAEASEVGRLSTGNAESNAAMLAINVAMGYRPASVHAMWQADLDVYRRSLKLAPRSSG
jgi:GNAT superfamily N-acetyltransferase